MKFSRIALFSLPLIFSLTILVICYPGFMSYDSIRMLEEARSSVRGGIYPAFPVYILRLFDVTGYGVTLMLLVQNYLLLLSVTIILRLLGAGFFASGIVLISMLAMPTVIGCMLVLWKDVTVGCLMMISVALIYWASQNVSDARSVTAVKWISLISLLLGTLVRFNAVTATAFIAIYWIFAFFNNAEWRYKGGLFVAILLCMFSTNKIINGYALSDFRKLENNNLAFSIMSYDLIGISKWSGVSLVPITSAESDVLPKSLLANLDKVYSSLGVLAMNDNNAVMGGVVKLYPARYKNEDIMTAWLEAIYRHPVAYLQYRWDLFSEIIGAKPHPTFEPTHFNGIDENQFGIRLEKRSITSSTLKYIGLTSSIFLGKPWVLFLVSFVTVFLTYKSDVINRSTKQLAYFSAGAGVLYVAPFFIVSGTGEVRYTFPSIILCTVPILVWIFAHYLPKRATRTTPVC